MLPNNLSANPSVQRFLDEFEEGEPRQLAEQAISDAWHAEPTAGLSTWLQDARARLSSQTVALRSDEPAVPRADEPK